MTNFKQVVGGTRSQPIKIKEKFIKVIIKLKKNEIKLQKKTKRLLTQHLTIFTALFHFFQFYRYRFFFNFLFYFIFFLFLATLTTN